MDANAHLHGRIVALELLLRGIMTRSVMEDGKGSDFVAELRDEMLASLQLIQRDVGAYEDEVWSAASDALRSQFFEISKRVAHLRDEPPPVR